MKRIVRIVRWMLALLCWSLAAGLAYGQSNLEVNTPVVAQLKQAMQARHAQLEPLFSSGAIGLTRDGSVQVRDAGAIPLAQRQAAQGLVAAENADRAALYREIARANGKPEWEQEIRTTFGQRWSEKAPAGWWVQDARGNWTRK